MPNLVRHLGEKEKLLVHCEIVENIDFTTNFPVCCEMAQSAYVRAYSTAR